MQCCARPATERPFSSPLLKEHRKGTFVCAGCAQPLFNSATKFESGTGWPSFWKPLPKAVVTRPDRSLLAERTEVLCARCGGHLGHVFDDGPKPTGPALLHERSRAELPPGLAAADHFPPSLPVRYDGVMTADDFAAGFAGCRSLRLNFSLN